MKKIFLAIIAVCLAVAAYAQNQITVSGVVYDENSEVFPGVMVLVPGTNAGAATDEKGEFRIKVEKNGSLEFSMIGYKPVTIAVRGSSKLNVTLEPDRQTLDEVVVVGYGTMKRSDLTGSVASVSSKDIANFKTASAMEALQGMVAGLNITTTDGTPGADLDVKIRGVGTVNGDASPIYIVDGFETSGISHLANQDIASIEVLKDASATAIYGSRGANGVILVTTKSGRIGRPEISYNGSATYRTLSKRLDVLNPYEFVQLQMEINPTRYENVYYRTGTDEQGNAWRFQTIDDYKSYSGIDWQDQTFRNTWSQNHDVSVRGGSKESQYTASFSHYDDQGIFTSNSYAKNSARFKIMQKIFKWLTLNASVNYANIVNTGVGTGGGTLSNIISYRPTGGIRCTDEALLSNNTDPLLEEMGVSDVSSYNPLVNAKYTDVKKVTDQWDANGSLIFQFSKYLTLKVMGYYNTTNQRNDTFYRWGSSMADRNSGPYGITSTMSRRRYSNTNNLVYNRTFNKLHRMTVTLGHETSYLCTQNLGVEVRDFPLDNIGVDNYGLGATPTSTTSSKTDSRRLSFFGRGFYSYADKYMVTATFRADASSVFSENNKWGFFPSFAASWNLAKEPWLKNADWLSALKLRAGWGMVGNDRITNYLSLDLYGSSYYGLGTTRNVSLSKSHLPNKDLKWEASQTTNLGLDLSFFKERLNVTADAFIKDSKDLLMQQDIQLSSGFSTQWQNVGQIRNKGIELSLKSVNIGNKHFTWRTDFNISFIRNTLVALNSGKDYLLSKSGISSNFASYDYIAKVGEPIGSMYGYVFDGVYQLSDFEVLGDGTRRLKKGVADISEHAGETVSPGFVKYKDLDGDGIITTADQTIIGNGQPKYYGGLNNTFNFYGVDLSFLLSYVVGNDIYNAQRMFNTQSRLERLNMLGELRDRWTTTNASNTVPSAKGYVAYDVYSRFIEDGSFLRLSNITLGYTLPARLTQRFYVSGLRFYVTAQNLFCLTNYSGSDPEVSMRTSPLMPSFDYGAYPKSKSFTGGIQLTF